MLLRLQLAFFIIICIIVLTENSSGKDYNAKQKISSKRMVVHRRRYKISRCCGRRYCARRPSTKAILFTRKPSSSTSAPIIATTQEEITTIEEPMTTEEAITTTEAPTTTTLPPPTTTLPPPTTTVLVTTTIPVITTTTCPICLTHDNCKQDKELLNATLLDPSKPIIPGEIIRQGIGERTYHINKGHMLSWFDAYRFCYQHNLTLVRIETLAEKSDLAQVLKGLGMISSSVFTDGHKIGKCDYQWSNNSTMNYTAWKKGQPGQINEENCMIMYILEWHDLKCTDKAEYICEGPITTTQCPELCLTDDCKQDDISLDEILSNSSTPLILRPIVRHEIGGKTYHISKGHMLNWFDAYRFCYQNNLTLVRIESQAEQDALATYLETLGMTNSYVYTDGHKIGSCEYQWSDAALDMNFTAWETGQPGQMKDENCMIMYKSKWYDLKCNGTDKADYICEGPITMTTTPCPICNTSACIQDKVRLDALLLDPKSPVIPGVLVPFTINERMYHINKGHILSWFDAYRFCYQHNMTLLRIESQIEQDAVVAKLETMSMNIDSAIFTDGHKIMQCVYKSWSDNSTLNYTSWEPGQPSDVLTENCLVLSKKKWSDYPCDGSVAASYICEGETTTTPCPTICKTPNCLTDNTNLDTLLLDPSKPVIPGPEVFHIIGEHTYHINKGAALSWFDAYRFCFQHNMTLVRVESQAEQDALVAKLGTLGMNDGYIFADGHKINRCDYQWSDNSTMNYTSWETGEPGQKSTENCLVLWKTKWFDLPCDGTYAANYMCESPTTVCPSTCVSGDCLNDRGKLDTLLLDPSLPVIPGAVVPHTIGGKQYHINGAQKLNWFDAYRFCTQNNMDLLTIESQAEQDAMSVYLNTIGLGPNHVFMGAHKIDKCKYEWFDNSSLEYTAWQPNEPSQTTIENCIIIWQSKWWDLPCSAETFFICETP